MKTRFTYTTESEIRAAFWEAHPTLASKRRSDGRDPQDVRQNEQPADTRAAFVDFVDFLARDGSISEELAGDVTL